MKYRTVFAASGALALAGCGLNSVPTAEENAKAKWADVENYYQRRADLIPNLVATVKAAGAQEKAILVEVTQARASASQVKVSGADLNDPAKVQAYEQAQAGLTLSLQRLQEAYPELKSQGNYATLMDQLEGTENRISTARHDYNEAVQSVQHDDPHLPRRDRREGVLRREAAGAVQGDQCQCRGGAERELRQRQLTERAAGPASCACSR